MEGVGGGGYYIIYFKPTWIKFPANGGVGGGGYYIIYFKPTWIKFPANGGWGVGGGGTI